MIKTYSEWVDIVNNLAYDEVLVDMLSDWRADGSRLTARIAELWAEIETRDKRVAELEALVQRLVEAGNKLGTYFIGYTPRKKELLQREFWEAWRSAVSDWQSMTSHVTNPSDSQGIVTRNGGEG